MFRRAYAISIILLLALSPAWAGEKEKPLPKDLPPYGAVKPFAAPQAAERSLANGLTLRLAPRRGFPKVAFAVAVRGGLAADPKDRPGLSELIVATIDQGTKTRNARQIAEAIQAAGGDLSGNARADSILVATSVVEVGLDVANATLMIVEEAQRFGLAQLHQLRGRVGRGAEKSYCILLSPTHVSETARLRLETLTKERDGFKIAELDLQLRGPGEFLGLRQHGFPDLKIASLDDFELIGRARRKAEEVLFEKKEPVARFSHLLRRWGKSVTFVETS